MRRIYRLFFFLCVLLGVKQEIHAQTFCATDEVHRHLLRANPEYKKAVELQDAKWQQYSKEIITIANRLAVAEADLFEIPVVFHVIHNGEDIGTPYNPSDNDLIASIANLNAIFAANYHAGGINTDGSVEIPIRFKLAQRTPDCQPSNGINRVNGSVLPGYSEFGVIWPGNTSPIGGASDAEVKALSSWPTTAYLNIWLVTQIQGAGGYAYLPVGPPGVDGIVIVAPGIVGILAHEVGHYLGLYHTFQGDGGGAGGGGSTCPRNDDCTIDGDMICDTEPHYLQGCQIGINPCTNQPWGPVVRNFMNYGPCEGMFTAGQRDRMLFALEELRGSLLTSLGGLPPGIDDVITSPIAAACLPAGILNPGSDMGPRDIMLSDMQVVTGGYSGDNNQYYIDHTIPSCLQKRPVARLIRGNVYTITVTTGNNRENVRGWIDFNNNGIFQSSELVISSNGTTAPQTHTGSFTVPATGIATCTSLRMRIMSDNAENNNPLPQPCSQLLFGQAEDFIVILRNSSSPLPSVNIVANTTSLICEGTNVTFTATPVSGGNNPVYQWKKNGINVGANNRTYITNGLVNGDIISCVMTPAVACSAYPVVTSNLVTMSVIPSPPSISITATPAGLVCKGSSIVLKATQVNGGSSPGYQWKKNGIAIGTNSDTFISNALLDGDVITCVLTIVETCPATQSATSDPMTMTISSPPSGTVVPPSPVAACTPGRNLGTEPGNSAGPLNILLADLQFSSYGNDDHYIDHTFPAMPNCLPAVAHLNGGGTYTITINTGFNRENVRGWIDFNNDGIFQSTELIISSNGTTSFQTHTSSFSVPSTGIAACTSLRMRIMSDFAENNNPAPEPCSALLYGRTEDFIAIIENATSPLPSVSISVSQNGICKGTNVTFTATPVNGGNNPTYHWRLNGFNIGTNSSTFSSSTLAFDDVVSCVMTSSQPGTCNPTVGSNGILMAVYNVVTPSVSIEADITGPVCAGTKVTFFANPINGAMPGFQWKINGINVSNRAYSYSTSTLANGDVITCVITSADPCARPQTATSNSITMVVNPGITPSVSISASKNNICSGASVTFTATAINGGINPKYQWKVGNTLVGSNSPTYTSTNLANGAVVTCTLTSSSTCLSISTVTSQGVTMTVGSSPLASIVAGGPLTFCLGKNVLFRANLGPGYTYQWKKGGVNIDNATTSNYTATVAGAYSVVVTNVTGCSTTSGVSIVTVNNVPLATVAVAGPLTFCEGKTVQLKAITGTGYTYQWKRGGTNIPGATLSNYTASTNGIYNVVVTNTSGCSATSAGFNVFVKPLPLATITPAGPTTFCSGKNVLLKANTGTNYTYQWKYGATVIPGAVQSTHPATLQGYYSVIVTNSSGCSVTSAAIAVTVKPLPVATITPAGPFTFCVGQNVILKANTGTNYTYQWRKAGVDIPGATQVNYTASSAGVYSVIVTNASGCPVTSAGVTVAVNNVPLVSVAVASATTFCAGKSVLLKATLGTAYTYQWRKNSIIIPLATSSNYTATETGVYSVVVTNVAGCSTTSTGINVAVMIAPAATVAIVGPTTFCEGKSVLLKANLGTGYTYQWKRNGINIPAQTQSEYTATTTGAYTVAVTNVAGCTTLSSGINVTVTPAPAAFITANGPLTFVQGGNVLLNATSAAGNTYQWKKDGVNITGATTESYIATAGGNYTVAITNAGGCQAVSQPTLVTVTQTRPITKGWVEEEEMIRVYPNPLYRNDYVNVDWNISNVGKGILATVYDMTGRKINSQRLKPGDSKVKITGASGMYVVELRWGMDKRKTFKVIKVD